MTNPERALSPEDADFLARWTRETRDSPTRFARGAAFLERQFSFDEIKRKRKKRYEAGNAPRAALRQTRANELREMRSGQALFLWPRDEVLAWARECPSRMSSDEAEAVLLVAVFFYDNEATPNPALPRSLQQLPVGRVCPPGKDPRWLDGREIVFAMHGPDAELIRAARWAESRLKASAPDVSLPRRRKAGLSPKPTREDRAWEGFLAACQEDRSLDQDTPRAEHHAWLKENKPELLVGAAKKDCLTWMRYARGGRLKFRGRLPGTSGATARSVVRARDLERDADS